jgi:uncharacterized membrane protein YbhN (UPF0104 family)
MPAPHESFSTFKNWYMMGFDPRSKISSMLKALKTGILRVRISVVLTTLFALALLALVSYLATARNSGSDLWKILQGTWLLVLALTFPYLAARALVWQELLRQLGIKVPWRQMAVSFAGGEITKTLPAGVYVQNYLLARLVHFGSFSVVRSSMATTAMLGLEATIALPVALIFGVPHQPWIFWTLIAVVVVWIVVLIFAWLLVHPVARRYEDKLPSPLRKAREFVEEFLDAGRELITWKTLRALVPTILYMCIYAVELYAILLAAGIHNISFADTLGIYALTVLAVILVPIPTEIGLTEVTGLGALTAYGVPRSTAAIVMLSLRILATGMTILVAAAVIFFLRGELVAGALTVGSDQVDSAGEKTAASQAHS